MKKTLVLLIALFSFVFSLSAQKADLKKGIVYFDGNPVYSYEKEMLGNITLVYKKDTKELVFSIHFHNNGTTGYSEDDYLKLYFAEANRTIETTQLRGVFPKGIVERLRKYGVLENDGTVNPQKLEIFAGQYDEKISSRLISR